MAANTTTTKRADLDVTVERELTTFLIATFAISWGVGVGGSFIIGPGAYLLGVFGPTIAALWATRRYEGSVRSMWAALGRWRVGIGWYAIAIATPVVLLGAAWAAVVGLGRSWEVDDPLPVAAALGFFLLAMVIAGGPEEPGWRGYALPRLQSRWNALTASLVLGAIWAVWHAPLWLMPDLPFEELSFPLYAWQAVAMSVVYTWLFNNTRGSVLLAVILHASTNVAGLYLATSVLPQLALSTGWTVVAIGLVVIHGHADLAPGARIDRDRARREAGSPLP